MCYLHAMTNDIPPFCIWQHNANIKKNMSKPDYTERSKADVQCVKKNQYTTPVLPYLYIHRDIFGKTSSQIYKWGMEQSEMFTRFSKHI